MRKTSLERSVTVANKIKRGVNVARFSPDTSSSSDARYAAAVGLTPCVHVTRLLRPRDTREKRHIAINEHWIQTWKQLERAFRQLKRASNIGCNIGTSKVNILCARLRALEAQASE